MTTATEDRPSPCRSFSPAAATASAVAVRRRDLRRLCLPGLAARNGNVGDRYGCAVHDEKRAAESCAASAAAGVKPCRASIAALGEGVSDLQVVDGDGREVGRVLLISQG